MNNDTIRSVTTSIIAIAVIVGGGLIIFLQPANPNINFICGAIGSVLGYYLNHIASAAGANIVLKAQDQAAVTDRLTSFVGTSTTTPPH